MGLFDDPFATDTLLSRPAPKIRPLSPEDTDTALNRILGGVTGGLKYVADTLGKPGRAVRGLLAGRPGELANLIPFSDFIGITDPEAQTSGEDLLKQWGILEGEGTKGTFELRDLAGPALEIALDPTTYLTSPLGALSKAGQAAKKAGTLAPTLREGIVAGQRGLLGVGLPFMDPSFVVGTGPTAQKVAGWIGDLGDAALYSGPGRTLSAMFDKRVNNAPDEITQRAARKAHALEQKGIAQARAETLGFARRMQDAGELIPERTNLIRNIIEEIDPPPIRETGSTLINVTDDIRKSLANRAAAEQALGIDTRVTENYFPRYQTELDQATKGFSKEAPVSPLHPSLRGRQEIFEGLTTEELNELAKSKKLSGPNRTLKGPEGNLLTEAAAVRKELGMTDEDDLRRFFMGDRSGRKAFPEAQASIFKKEQRLLEDIAELEKRGKSVPLTPEQQKIIRNADAVRARNEGLLKEAYAVLSKSGRGAKITPFEQSLVNSAKKLPLSPEELADLERLSGTAKQAEGLADWLSGLDPQYAEKGLDYFGNSVLTDFERRGTYGARAMARATTLLDTLAGTATTKGDELTSVPLKDVVESLGLKNWDGASQQLIDRLGVTPEKLIKLRVPKEVADNLGRFLAPMTQPEAMKGLLGAFDSLTNLTKAGQTLFFPAKYARDFFQGMFSSWVHGGADPTFNALDPRAWLKPMFDAKTAIRDGGVIADANKIAGFENLTPAMATRALIDEMHNLDVLGKTQLTEKAAEVGGEHVAQKMFKMPGEAKESALDILKSAVPKTREEWNPLNIRGVSVGKEAPGTFGEILKGGGEVRKTTKFAPGRAGEKTAEMIDDINRGAFYIAKRRQGFTPEAALEATVAAHYDFTRMSQFERGVMRRLIPYYGWIKANTPAVINELLKKPGGKMASTIKFGEAMRSDEGFVPEAVGEGLVLPIGKEEDGTQRYLSRLGLPYEDVFPFVPGNLERTLQTALANLNPIIKAPLELAAGEQFYSGKDLDQLYSQTGNPLIDQLLANSPLGRTARSIRTLVDPRKDLTAIATNLLSPARMTDVDLEKRRQIEGQEALDRLIGELPEARQMTRQFVPKKLLSQLEPQEIELLRLAAGLEAQKKKTAKEREKKKAS